MRQKSHFCDVCKKEITDKIYINVGYDCDYGWVVRPRPSKIDACSEECAVNWLTGVKLAVGGAKCE